jgi:hypothetical protein
MALKILHPSILLRSTCCQPVACRVKKNYNILAESEHHEFLKTAKTMQTTMVTMKVQNFQELNQRYPSWFLGNTLFFILLGAVQATPTRTTIDVG